jgi:hypothetical protein
VGFVHYAEQAFSRQVDICAKMWYNIIPKISAEKATQSGECCFLNIQLCYYFQAE